ncbi:MAG: DUF4157 domain-containing protein [Minicystis sp.]
MSMAKAPVASQGEKKTGGASGLQRKVRAVAPEMEGERGPLPMGMFDLSRVTAYPPGGRPARDVGWSDFAPALADKDGEQANPGSDGERSAKPSFAAVPVFPPTTGRAATSRGVLQAKLAVGSVDDPLEEEADQVAERVLRMPDPVAAAGAPEEPPEAPVQPARARLSRKEEDEETGSLVQRRAAPEAPGGVGAAPPIVEQALQSGARALDAETRAYFEPRLGLDLGKVRIHTDAQAAEAARAVNAQAYTVGQDIVFGQGRYAPRDQAGRRLLAHELAHVAQQRPRGEAGPAARQAPAGVLRRKPEVYETRLREVVAGSISKNGYTAAAVLEIPGWTSDPLNTVASAADLATAVTGAYTKLKTVLLTTAGFKALPAGTMRLVATAALDEAAVAKVRAMADERKWKIVVYRAASMTSIVKEMTVDPAPAKPAAPADKGTPAKAPGQTAPTPDAPGQAAPGAQQAPPTPAPTHRIEAALKLLELAKKAVLQEPEDIPTATEILEKVGAVFMDIATDTKISDTFTGWVVFDQTSVWQYVVAARAAPKDLLGKIRSGMRGEKMWQDHIGDVVQARRYLEILAGDRPNRKQLEEEQKAFEVLAQQTAYSMLDTFKGDLEQQQKKYQDEANVTDLIAALGKTQIKEKFAAARAKAEEAGLDPGDTRVKNGPDGRPVNPAAQEKLDEAKAIRQEGVAEVRKVADKHPLVSYPDFPQGELATAEGVPAVKALIDAYITKHLEAIEESRGQIKDVDSIYALDRLVEEAYARQNITPGSVRDLAVQNRKAEIAHAKFLTDVVKDTFLVMFTIMTWGQGGFAIKVAQAVVAGGLAGEALDEYNKASAAHDAGLSSVKPSEAWALIACIGAGATVLGLFAEIAPRILPAIRAFNQGTDAKMLLEALRQQGASNEMIEAISELSGPGKTAERDWFGRLYERMGGNAEKLQQALKGRRISEMTAAEIEALIARTSRGVDEAAQDLRLLLENGAPLNDPAVVDALVRMADQAIRTKALQLEKFIDEIRGLRVKAGLPEMTATEVGQVKEAWEQAKRLEASAAEPIEITSKRKPIGSFSQGNEMVIKLQSKEGAIYGGNTVKLDPNATTTVTGTLDDVNVIARRGERVPGATLQGANPGGINILRSPKWQQIIKKYDALKAADPAKFWKTVTNEFWETVNKPWLEEAMARGDKFRLVSDPTSEAALFTTNDAGEFILENGQKTRSIFGREVDLMKANGYEFLPDGTAVKK